MNNKDYITRKYQKVNVGDGEVALTYEYGQSTSGDGGQSLSGDDGQSTSGDDGQSLSGDRGQSLSGIYGQSLSGDSGQSTSGDSGQSTSGERGQSTSGYKGQSTSGYRGQSLSGYLGESFTRNGRVRAGKGGVLYISWVKDKQREFLACKVGEMGTKPDTWYELSSDKTKFVEVK